jgi:hypothetical protein
MLDSMMWLLLVPLWCVALVSVVALCRAGHLEDVARGFVDEQVRALDRPRTPALPLAR